MSQQEEGWPLGLQPLNVRSGLLRINGHDHDHDHDQLINASLSFSTLITGSPSSSTHSSSDLDTESTGSFFHDKSITLGSLIGITSILELSRRSTRRRTVLLEPIKDKKISNKSRTWLFSLCSKLSSDGVAVSMNNSSTPSLAHLLEAERRASATIHRNGYGHDDFTRLSDSNANDTLFIDGQVAPPDQSSSSSWLAINSDSSKRSLFDEQEENGHGSPLIFSCLCGHLSH